MKDLQTTLFWLRLIQLVIAIPLLALAGQGMVHVLTRLFGQDPKANFFYRLLETVASPFTRACRYITPRFVAERHLPLVALSLLVVGYVWTMLAIANACIGRGPARGPMPAGSLSAGMGNRFKRWYFDQAAAWCVLFRRRDLALEYYARMLELDPGDALALASIAFQTAQQGRKREALAMFDRLLQVTPGDAEAHFNRGFLLQELNDHAGAMAAFERAIALNPDHDRAHYGLGAVAHRDAAPGRGAGAAAEEHEAAADEPVRLVSACAGAARTGPHRGDARGARPPRPVRAQGRAAAGT